MFFTLQLTSRPVVVGGPWGGNWKSFSAGPGANWNGTQAWAPGLTGTVRSVPKGYTQSILLRAGPAGQGVNAAVFDWGEALRASRPTKGRKVADVTMKKSATRRTTALTTVSAARRTAPRRSSTRWRI